MAAGPSKGSTSSVSADRMDNISSEECEESESEGCEPSATSILDVLRAPNLSVLNRKRKVLSNRGRGGKRRRSSSSTSSEPRRVTPLQRVKEFAGEQLVVSSGKLFCKACREELSLKSSTVKNHV